MQPVERLGDRGTGSEARQSRAAHCGADAEIRIPPGSHPTALLLSHDEKLSMWRCRTPTASRRHRNPHSARTLLLNTTCRDRSTAALLRSRSPRPPTAAAVCCRRLISMRSPCSTRPRKQSQRAANRQLGLHSDRLVSRVLWRWSWRRSAQSPPPKGREAGPTMA